MSRDWAANVRRYWFDELGANRWWVRDEAVDRAIADRFADLWEEKRCGEPADFLDSAEQALAGVVPFDQFPRNLFRGEARAFSTDRLARSIAEGAIARGYDGGMSGHERQFLYMPFMHSEDLPDQRRSLELFEALGDDYALGFTRDHHELIARFGRFPHRNAALGRETRSEEEEAVEEGAGW